MAGIISFVHSISPLIIVLLGTGIMFRIVRFKSVAFYLLFLVLLPFLLSSIYYSVTTGFSSINTWKEGVIIICIFLVAARILIDRYFRRNR